MKFTQKLAQAVSKAGSNLCVGLDPYLERIPKDVMTNYRKPEDRVTYFLKEVIQLTAPHCAAFKPNLAFFEALGPAGLDVFQQVLNFIPDNKIVIADAKRGDISSTADHYARAYFEVFGVDAVTLNPLMGFDTLNSFLNYAEKAVFVLTLTSNPGASDVLTKSLADENTTAEYIAKNLSEKNKKNSTHIGMVVGATQAENLQAVLHAHPGSALLIPGIGAQGGSLKEFQHILNEHEGIPLFNSSRGILYAGESGDEWQKDVEQKAEETKNRINSILTDNA